MNIGIVESNSRIVKKNGQEVVQEWLDLHIRCPFMPSMVFSVTKAKQSNNANAPIYNIWFNYKKKGEKDKAYIVKAKNPY